MGKCNILTPLLSHHFSTSICVSSYPGQAKSSSSTIPPGSNLAQKYSSEAIVGIDEFKSIKIPIPSLDRQQEIVEYCKYNDALIKQLEKEIENNKKQAQQFITGIVKAQVQTDEQRDTSSVNTEPIDEVQNEIVSVEEEVIIEPKPKTKIIIKKKVKKPLVIVEKEAS